jgi:manganese/zinc/iron transport system permease protein
VCVLVLVVVGLLYKELKLLCFDRAFAESLGWRASLLDLGLMALVAVCTVVGLPAVGVVLMVSLLVIPAAAARFWTERLGVMLVVSGLIGMGAGVAGTALSATVALPTGPLVTLAAAGAFAVSMLFAPERGVIGQVFRRRGLGRRIAVQHVLRRVYEVGESGSGGEGLRGEWTKDAVHGMRDGGRGLRLAMREGLVAEAGLGRYRLTGYGVEEAARVVRAHRLWELFLTEEASVSPERVDRGADQVEHVLGKETVARLEEQLRREGRLPEVEGGEGEVPASVHEVGEGRRA